jgi:polyhydroxyalkanoate synthesis regulator phasin
MNEDFQGDIEGRILEFLRQRQIPTKNEFQTLTQKIEALSKKLEDIISGEAK